MEYPMTKSNLPTTTSDLIGSLMAVETQIAAPSTGGGDFLQLKEATGWTYGQDKVETEDGAKWAINPASMAKGFIFWSKDSRVLGDVLQPVTQGLIPRDSLEEINEPSDNGWASQCGFTLSCVSGEDKGQEVLYKASTMGADREFARLYNEIIAKAKSGSPDIVPIILLERGGYDHPIKVRGFITEPVFKIVGWQGLEDTEVSEEPEAVEVIEEEAPKRRRRRKVA